MKTIILLTLSVLLVVQLVNSSGINCNGKGFICADDSRFRICVDDGEGNTQTADNLMQKCPPGTSCKNNNKLECSPN